MNVFISYAKPRGEALAQALQVFIRRVVPGTEPWVSSDKLDPGGLFRGEIQKNLGASFGGIVCITSESQDERWLLYEAGALSVRGPVWTVLLDVEKTDVEAPLGDFQHTRADRDDVWKLIEAIHQAAVKSESTKQSASDLSALFDALWEPLRATIENLRNEGPQSPPKEREDRDLLVEAVERLRRLDSAPWRPEKTHELVKRIYVAITKQPVPSLDELRQRIRAERDVDVFLDWMERVKPELLNPTTAETSPTGTQSGDTEPGQDS